MATVISRIYRLILEVTLKWRHASISDRISGSEIAVKPTITYVNSFVDPLIRIVEKWNFGAYFREIDPRLINMAAALGRLIPNRSQTQLTVA